MKNKYFNFYINTLDWLSKRSFIFVIVMLFAYLTLIYNKTGLFNVIQLFVLSGMNFYLFFQLNYNKSFLIYVNSVNMFSFILNENLKFELKKGVFNLIFALICILINVLVYVLEDVLNYNLLVAKIIYLFSVGTIVLELLIYKRYNKYKKILMANSNHNNSTNADEIANNKVIKE